MSKKSSRRMVERAAQRDERKRYRPYSRFYGNGRKPKALEIPKR